MTPYELERTRREAMAAVKADSFQRDNAIFHMLTVLLQHEADKEAARNLEAREP